MNVDYDNLTGAMIPHALATLRPGSAADLWPAHVRQVALGKLRDAIVQGREEGFSGVIPEWLTYDLAHPRGEV